MFAPKPAESKTAPPSGLRNIHNNCYQNSLIQSLLTTSSFLPVVERVLDTGSSHPPSPASGALLDLVSQLANKSEESPESQKTFIEEIEKWA
jgi:uncharacterized UBP type Zn finger protein